MAALGTPVRRGGFPRWLKKTRLFVHSAKDNCGFSSNREVWHNTCTSSSSLAVRAVLLGGIDRLPTAGRHMEDSVMNSSHIAQGVSVGKVGNGTDLAWFTRSDCFLCLLPISLFLPILSLI